MNDPLTTESVRLQFVEAAHPSWRADREEAFDKWLTAVRESAFEVEIQDTPRLAGSGSPAPAFPRL